jgi:hypothetical protein
MFGDSIHQGHDQHTGYHKGNTPARGLISVLHQSLTAFFFLPVFAVRLLLDWLSLPAAVLMRLAFFFVEVEAPVNNRFK